MAKEGIIGGRNFVPASILFIPDRTTQVSALDCPLNLEKGSFNRYSMRQIELFDAIATEARQVVGELIYGPSRRI
jgi:hypothetical protein